MTKNNEQIIIDNLGSEKCVHRAHLGYKGAPYFKKCYSCRLQNHQLEAVQANNTTEYWYKCNTKNCLFKKLEDKKQECEQKDKIIKFLTKGLDNSFKTQQDSELYWEREKKKLKAENKELNSKCSQLEENIKDLTAKNNEYIDKNHDLVVQAKVLKSNRLNMFEHLDIVQENKKLKKTLAEVKEVCKSVENIENVKSLYDASLSGMYLQAKKILQKINEVEDEIKN